MRSSVDDFRGTNFAGWLPHESGEFERIRPHLTPLECGIIVGGIPEEAISRKVGLIWGIPAKTNPTDRTAMWNCATDIYARTQVKNV